MSAATKNFIIEQNASFGKSMTYRDKTKKPINLTGFSARMQIRDTAGLMVADLSTGNGKITLGGVTGVIVINISVAETSLMTFASALYDLKLIAPSGFESRILQGKVSLSLGQTT